MTDLIGADVSHYHILEQLGEGGMATVYRAVDNRQGVEVALKFIRADQLSSTRSDTILRRFEFEKSLAQLTHPNIVPIRDYGQYEGRPYLVMDLVPGGTLKRKLGQAMDCQKAARLLAPIARALHYLHEHDIVHRDVKPSNILLNVAGLPMLSDFGIAKLMQSSEVGDLTRTGMGIGTPEYMAPEQALGKGIGPAADIYALGTVLYELVTGRTPYKADTPLAVVYKQINDPLPRPKTLAPNLPEYVERVLFKALAKEAGERYASAAEFAGVLEKIAIGQRLTGNEAPRLRQPKGIWLRRLSISLGVVVLLALLGVLSAFATGLLSGAVAPNPTPTVPTGFVYVAETQGDTFSQHGAGAAASIVAGTLLPAGAGSRVRTADGQLQLNLSDGAAILLGPQSELELSSVVDPSIGSSATLLKLNHGQVFIIVALVDGQYFAVQGGNGLRAEAQGATLGVAYDSGRQRLDLDCFAGHCRLVGTSTSLDLGAGQHSWLDAFGGPFPADGTRLDIWAFAAIALPRATPTPPDVTDPVTTRVSTSTTIPSPTLSSPATRTPNTAPSASATHTRGPASATARLPTATNTARQTPTPMSSTSTVSVPATESAQLPTSAPPAPTQASPEPPTETVAPPTQPPAEPPTSTSAPPTQLQPSNTPEGVPPTRPPTPTQS